MCLPLRNLRPQLVCELIELAFREAKGFRVIPEHTFGGVFNTFLETFDPGAGPLA